MAIAAASKENHRRNIQTTTTTTTKVCYAANYAPQNGEKKVMTLSYAQAYSPLSRTRSQC
jgi:metal-sulfur cluster biosynthetic enzyme